MDTIIHITKHNVRPKFDETIEKLIEMQLQNRGIMFKLVVIRMSNLIVNGVGDC